MTEGSVRRFASDPGADAVPFGAGSQLLPGVTATEGGALSAYAARLLRGEHAPLPADYEEIWVILTGHLRIVENPGACEVRGGEYLHVPRHAPGAVLALADTTLVAVSVPAH